MNIAPLRIPRNLLALKALVLLVFLTLGAVSTSSASSTRGNFSSFDQTLLNSESSSMAFRGNASSSQLFSTEKISSIAADATELLVLDTFDEWTVGGGYLYWATNCSTGPTAADTPRAISNHYALHRWPINGGTPETIVTIGHSNCDTFNFLAADDDGVFYWNDSQSRLENYPIGREPGQGPIVVRSNINTVTTDLHLDNSHIYFANDDRIRRVTKNGNSSKWVQETGSFVRSIAVDTGRNDIYWIDGNGLWYGRKNCSSPPCNKSKLNGTTGYHIALGATGIVPRTVYMVEEGVPPVIRSYDCQEGSCTSRKWYEFNGTPTVLEVGLPAFTQTGISLSTNWLVWPERRTNGGRLRQRELDPINTPSTTTHYSGSDNISMKAIIEGGQVYFADQEAGNEQIMRVPITQEASGQDFGNLSPINNPELSADWKPIVRVESTWADTPDEIYFCTGTLIDPGIVITAGRCIYNQNQGQPAASVRVIPAYVDGNEPFGEAYQAEQWVFDEFKNDGDANYNIGWIKLERPIGALTGWYDIGYADDVFMMLSTFHNLGYPRANFDGQFLYGRNGRFRTINVERLKHTAEAAAMKGSPAINLDDSTVYAIESHLLGEIQETIYARLTQAKVEQIESIIDNTVPKAVDLVPLKLRVPTSSGLRAGTWLTLESFVLHNYSTASTTVNQTVAVSLYLSEDDSIDESDTFLATGSFQIPVVLNGRETITIPSITWDGSPAIPLDMPPGDYWFGLVLDEDDAVPANNVTQGWDASPVQILPPQMNVTPDTLTAVADIGDPPIEETITVDILGDGSNNPDYNWTVIPNVSWLSVSQSSGGDDAEVTLFIDGNGLSSGTYHGQVNFATDLQDGNGLPVAAAAIDVTLYVDIGEAVWQPEPAELYFEAIAGGPNPSSQGLIIKAAIDYPFNWIVEDGSPVSSDAPWLPINSGAGTAPGVFNVAPDISGLPPGEYSTQLATHTPGQENYTLTTVNLTIYEAGPPQPILQLSPTTLFYETTVGQPNPEQQSFAISNIGTGQLTWTVSTGASWLSIDQTGGTGDAVISVGVSDEGLSPGTHVGQISVADGSGNEQVMRAVLQLRQPPTMVVDGSYLVFNGLTGQSGPHPQSFLIRNVGTDSFNWFLTETSPWLATNASDGMAPSNVEVVADTADLEAGSYQSNIEVTSPNALDSPQEVDVRLFLRPGPIMAASPQVLDFSMVAGTPSSEPESLTISNLSHGEMEWTAESNVNWLSLGQSAGVTGAFASTSVNVSINAADLNPRDEAYVGQITLRSSNGEGSPQTITVYLHVFSPARYCNIPNGGQGYVVNSRNARIRFTDVQRTLTPDGGCNFSARLRASLPQNGNLESQVSGHVDSNNVFIPTASSPLQLQVAILTLQLTDSFSISDEFGLRAEGGQWKLPHKYGGNAKNFNGTIQIDSNGIALEGSGRFDLPNINYGAMRIRQLQGEVSVAADWSYIVEVRGDMEIEIVGDGTSIKNIELSLDQRGFRSGRIGMFTIKDIAGVDIEIVSATFDSDRIRANKAILAIPQAWGGAEGALYGLVIDFDGKLTVTGGRFKLPSINAGGDSFKLASLEGEFRSVSGGYEIQARGEFGMRGFGDSGGCTLIVDVTIFSDAGNSMLVIDSIDEQQPAVYATSSNPHDAQAIEGIALRELTLGIWDCKPGLPIGATGFELTGIEGTVKLRSSLEEVSIRMQIQSVAKLGSIPFVSVEPSATLQPDPFFLGYSGPTFIINAEMSDTSGYFEKRRFAAEMNFSFIVLHGSIGIEAGLNNSGNFYLEGNGRAEVSITKGSVFKECFAGLCANMPPVTLKLANVDIGVSLQQIRGSVTVYGYGVSFKYGFQTGDFDVSLESLMRAITSEDIRQARTFQRHHVGPMPTSYEQITFVDHEIVLLTLPVYNSIPQADSRGLAIAQLATEAQSDALFILVQPTDGQLAFVLIDPNGQEYTSANLPQNIQFEQSVADGTQQMVYSVAQAQPGPWQTRVEGDINGTDFAVFETVNVAPGVMNNISLTPTSNRNELEVQWQYLAQDATPSIKIYANAHEITQTVTYTDSQGVLVTGMTDKFIGEPVAEFSNPATDGRIETSIIDLSQLPSGSYAFWIEAEGTETSGIRCYIRQFVSGCAESVGEVARFIVDHNSTFPNVWNPDITADVAIGDGLLYVSWDAIMHPDVDSYLLTVRGEDVLRPGQETTAEISVPIMRDQSSRVTATVDSIEPSTTYRLTVMAIDEEGGHSVQGPELVMVTPQPDFYISSPDVNILLQAGGDFQIVNIDLMMSSNLPYDPVLFLDYDRLPDGIYVEFAEEFVGQRPTSRITASISAASGLPPGHYIIPIVARSGELEEMLNLSIEVTPRHYIINLPLVIRQN